MKQEIIELRVSISTEAISSKAESSSKAPHLSYMRLLLLCKVVSPLKAQIRVPQFLVTAAPHWTLPKSLINVVLYGVDECPSGTSHSARLAADLESVVSVCATIDSTFQAQALKDCFRLGKYNPAHDKVIC